MSHRKDLRLRAGWQIAGRFCPGGGGGRDGVGGGRDGGALQGVWRSVEGKRKTVVLFGVRMKGEALLGGTLLLLAVVGGKERG